MCLFVSNRFALAACFFACVFAGQSQPVRMANTSLALPPTPPTFGYTTSNAFPGLTFTNPICIASPPGETNRLFIVGKNGVISVITNLAAPNKTVFMDLTPQVSSQNANSGTAGERGLLGMAFHPDFAANGFFYLFYMPTNATLGGYFDRLARFKISTGNPNQGDTNSQIVIFDQYDRDPNHNAGDIHFGADGYLYISVGDEGAEHDGRNCAQIITNSLFAGLLRIDVDKRLGNLAPNPGTAALTVSTNYLIPADNPFIGITNYNGFTVNSNLVRTEFWATGLRNPWRWNFDFNTNAFGTNVLYCGDVGQDKYEEVDVIQKGDNLGWAYWEGTNVSSGGSLPHNSYLTSSGTQVRFPIVHYGHGSLANQGNCIIGGVVYRGSNLPQLYGSYVYCDYVDGNIWTLTASNFTASVTNVNGASGPGTPIISDSTLNVTAFGTDPRNGDVLLCATKTTGFATAAVIHKIVYNSTVSGAPLPPTLADTGAFTNLMALTNPLAPLQPAPGILPYIINVPFWSDNAIKSRWLSVPNTNLTIGFNPNGNWSFPTGTVWIKHFNLQLTNGSPASEIRLETRLLVKNAGGVYGMSYRWGNSKTNATLVSAAGLDENFTINDGGILRTQVWHYPSQNECVTCHTPAGGFGLGTRTEQLNCDYNYGSGATNQLQALSIAGYFSSPVTNDVHALLALAAATNDSASLEFRSRSFLAVNCAQCHQPAGTVSQANWDARITTPTALAGLINGALINNLGSTSNFVIAPHLPTNSVLLTRLATRGANSIQMPPLATALVDITATNLITQWILSLTNTFWLGASPDPQTTTPGSSAVFSVVFAPTGDYTNDVNLGVGGLPSGAAGNFSPAIVNGTTTNSTLTIMTTGATPSGTYALTLTGSGGMVTNTDTFSLIIVSNLTAPGTLIWSSGGANANWSSALNWTNVTAGGYGPPTPANTVLFTNNAATPSASAPNNVVDANFIIGALQFANNAVNTAPNYHVTQINAGQTLVMTNGISVGTATDAGAAQVVNAVITGVNGTLSISNGVVAVTQGSGTDGAHTAVLDLSGLGTLNLVNVSRLAVAVAGIPPQTGNGLQRCSGVLYLAKTNFISVTSTGVTNGILVGWNDNTGNGTTAGVLNTANRTSALYLGQTNAIFTDAIYVGTDKTLGCLLAFNPVGLNNPTAYFRGLGGVNSRVSLWGIGDTSMKANSNQSASGTNDFSGGSVDALIGNLNIGVTQTGASGGNTGNGAGVLTFDAGIIDANNLTNGWSAGSGTVAGSDLGTGTVTVNGTATLKVNDTLALAMSSGGGAGVPSGTVNLNGGILVANTIVAGSGASALTLNHGTLILTNTAGSSAARLGTFTTSGATLRLRLNGSSLGTNICAATLNASGATSIVIDSVVNVSGMTTFSLISYAGTAPADGNFVKGTLPPGFSGHLINNTAQKRIDLAIAPNVSVTPRFNLLSSFGGSLIIGGTNGFPAANYYVLASTNLAAGLAGWQRIQTNPFDGTGAFRFTNVMDPAAVQNFFRLQLP
jgi:uncharacterized repeat protein (TIGR03806 family)